MPTAGAIGWWSRLKKAKVTPKELDQYEEILNSITPETLRHTLRVNLLEAGGGLAVGPFVEISSERKFSELPQTILRGRCVTRCNGSATVSPRGEPSRRAQILYKCIPASPLVVSISTLPRLALSAGRLFFLPR